MVKVVLLAGLLTCGLNKDHRLPKPYGPVACGDPLTAYSCEGSLGIGLYVDRTEFPFHPHA
jgi:hypothetical protein